MRTLFEHLLLLEYDHDKTWAKHGRDMENRLRSHYDEPPISDEEWNEKEGLAKRQWHQDIKHSDPTPHLEYGQWIARTYAKGGIRHVEDLASRVKPALERFHDAKRRGHLKRMGLNADINQYKSLSDLEDVVEKLPHPEPSDKDKPAPEEYTKHEDEHWTHVVPHTEKASQYYGRGTRWCTAASNHCMFKGYNQDGKLHIFIPKQARYPGEKYQLHHESDSFMDEKDEYADMKSVTSNRPMTTLKQYHHEMANSDDVKTRESVVDWTDDHSIHKKLSEDPYHHVRSTVAAKTPHHDIIRSMADSPDHTIRATIAKRYDRITGQHILPDVEDKLANDKDASVRAEIAERTKREDLHDRFSQPGESFNVYRGLVANHKAVTAHRKMAKAASEDRWDRYGSGILQQLAHRVRDHESQMNLARSNHTDIRISLAASAAGLHHDVLEKLSNDPSPNVTENLAHYFPDPKSSQIQNTENYPEYHRAMHNLMQEDRPALRLATRNEFHDYLLDNPHTSVRATVAAYTNKRAHVEKLMNDPDETVAKIARIKMQNRGHELR